MVLFDALYGYFHGAIGLSLGLSGLSILIVHRGERGLGAFGYLYCSIGALYAMSALDSVGQLPVDLDNLLFQGLILILGLSLIDISLYIFGNERSVKGRKALVLVGIGYELALVLLPLLDYAFGFDARFGNVEDSLVRGPIHAAAINAAYAWPLAAAGIALFIARWNPVDISGSHAETKRLIHAFFVLIPCMALLFVSLALSWKVSYRIAQLSLQLLLVAWYLYVVKHPRFLMKLRVEIGEEHAQRLRLGDQELALMRKRLEALASGRKALLKEDLDLHKLAKLIGVPAYRLSIFFSDHLSTTFIAWRNRTRIEYVCSRLLESPELTILDVSIEAGYRSKASFNAQFARIAGMSPSEYRARRGAGPRPGPGP